MSKEKKFIFYYELATEYGPLYIYKQYEEDPRIQFSHEIPVTREFFTQEEATTSYSELLFLDDTSSFTTEDRSIEGFIRESYLKELTPHEFLEKVAPYLESEELLDQKRKDVYYIFDSKARKEGNNKIIKDSPKVSEEFKDNIARKILKPYLKND